jgi:hypothetical protein
MCNVYLYIYWPAKLPLESALTLLKQLSQALHMLALGHYNRECECLEYYFYYFINSESAT